MSTKVKILAWNEAKVFAEPIRRCVFVIEQSVPEALEWDDEDGKASHALAFDNTGQALGYARLLPSKQLGRMAVLPEHRRNGIGSTLLLALETNARELGYDHIFLHAQVRAVAFYERHGYQNQGEPFDEAGIPHLLMTKSLAE